MRRFVAWSAALALALVILLPAGALAAKTSCDPQVSIPGWESLGYARVPLGLAPGTHTFTIGYSFVDVDGLPYEGSVAGSFDVDDQVPVFAGTAWVTPWVMFAPQPPHDRVPVPAINPDQPAVFVLGWGTPKEIPELSLTVTRQIETPVFHDMVQTVSLDGGPAVRMHFHQVLDSCFYLP